MATAEEGGATANTTSSSYGGGGAGGKFRKNQFRKQTTPYDRPPTGNSSNRSWLKKLVVEPASKLISYGADRFFASVIRPRLSQLPPPQPPEATDDMSDGIQGAVLNTQDGEQEPTVGEGRKPINSSSGSAAIELEQMLKQKTFTRSEIVYLTELLKSRAAENPSQNNEEPASDFRRNEQFASGHLGGNSNEGIRFSAVMSTPILNSKAFEEDIASPAELAKAYMGGRPSNVSPQVLRMHGQVNRNNMGLLSDVPFASKSPTISLTERTSVNLAAPENGFITPRSRGRSALYGMARTPYSRVHPASLLKGSGINSNGYAGPSMPSSVSVVGNDEKFESQTMTLKRRSSVLDDEAGSVGPIRRIRQKHNLFAPRIYNTAHGVGIGSHTKQKLQMMSEPRQKVLKTSGQNDDENVPSTSYAHVPSKSSEVASRIFLHLDNLTPKEKSSESKTVSVREKSSLSLTPNMLHGKALRSMEDMNSSMLQPGLHDEHQLGDRTNAAVPDSRDSSHRRQATVGETGATESVVTSGTRNPVINNDSAVSLKASRPSIGATDSVVANGACQPPQKKRAFRMSAQEDSFEDDDFVQSSGLASGTSFERKGLLETPFKDSKLPTSEEPKLVKTTIQPEDKLKSIEFSRGAVTIGERSNFNAIQASEETMAASPSAVVTQPIASSDKLKEANNPPSLPSESSKMPESELVISRSLVNPIASTGSEMKFPEVEKDAPLNPLKAGDMSGISGTSPFAESSGSLVPSSPSSASAESASSTITANCVPAGTTTSATFNGSIIFGSTAKPSSSDGQVLKFGASVDPPTANISEVAEQGSKVETGSSSGISGSKVETGPSSGISSSSHSTLATFGAANFGNSTSGLGFSVTSTSNDPQVSLFAGAKSLTFGAGTVSEGTSAQLISSASVPSLNTSNNTSFNKNSSASFGSLFSNSQSSNPNNTFGFTSSSSSTDTSKFALGTGTTSSPLKLGASSSVSDGTVVGPSSGATPVFSFGLSSSSSSTNAVGSTSSSVATPPFSFSGSTTSSFSSGTSSAFNFGGSSSSASSTINSAGTNSAPSIFGSLWKSPASSPSTGFSFSAPSISPTSTNAPPIVFNSSTSAATSPFFPFSGASAPVLSSPTQPVFGNNPPSTGFTASPGNGDQMNAEDSMAEDQVQSSAPSVPVFGQPSISPSPPGFTFGSTAPSQANPFNFGSAAPSQANNPFMFGGQQNQVAPQNPNPFQASGSLEFNAGGGSFSLGSTGGDKSGRKIIKINRNKNRRR